MPAPAKIPEPLTLALIGCGKMGSALLRGWLACDIASEIHVLEPHGLPPNINPDTRIKIYKNAGDLTVAAPVLDMMVIAVKPQIMDEVCAPLAPLLAPHTAILSIAAGQTIASFERRFGTDRAIIRAMPNTPAAIGKGITVAVPNALVTDAQKNQAHALLSATGAVEWIAEESLMNAVTALSGSGPAYIFLLIETLAAAGEKAGLPAALAMILARQTVIGSAALAEIDADIPAATLRENVTSPGGTTAAALEVLMNGNLQDIYDRALAAATARGKELSQG